MHVGEYVRAGASRCVGSLARLDDVYVVRDEADTT
jgi:hypothetical protein